MSLLKVKNLSVDFRSGKSVLKVIDNISFSVDKGEILALVGESGCGKSASCLALTGLLPKPPAYSHATSVEFEVENETVDLLKIPERLMRKIRGRLIAYIFQEPAASLNPVFRIGTQIAEVLELHRPEISDYRSEVIKLLDQVGIPAPQERINAYPHELSGGMQQRVMIAMALAGNPDLLIADEPTTALDVTIQAQILELIDNLRREREMAVILITHNLGIVSGLADKVAVMYAGHIVESGSREQVICNPKHPYTLKLLAAVPRPGSENKRRLETIPGYVPSPDKFPKGCRFFGRCHVAETLTSDLYAKCQNIRPEAKAVEMGHFVCCHAVEETQ